LAAKIKTGDDSRRARTELGGGAVSSNSEGRKRNGGRGQM